MRFMAQRPAGLDDDARGEQQDRDQVAGDDVAHRRDEGARRLVGRTRDAAALDEQRQRQQRGEAGPREDAGGDADRHDEQARRRERQIEEDGAAAPEPHDEVALADEAVLMEIGDRVDDRERP